MAVLMHGANRACCPDLLLLLVLPLSPVASGTLVVSRTLTWCVACGLWWPACKRLVARWLLLPTRLCCVCCWACC